MRADDLRSMLRYTGSPLGTSKKSDDDEYGSIWRRDPQEVMVAIRDQLSEIFVDNWPELKRAYRVNDHELVICSGWAMILEGLADLVYLICIIHRA